MSEPLKNPGAFGALENQYSNYETAAIVIVPVPYDGTSTWVKGSDRGPSALLEASANMELYDIGTDSEVYRKGIVTLDPLDCTDLPEEMVDTIYEKTSQIIRDGKFPVGIGGEHTISVGFVRAVVERHQHVTVLQLDAHADLRDSYENSVYNHACVMARIREICPIVQVGIRSMDISEKAKLNRSKVLFAHEYWVHKNPIEWINARLSENVYITIDLDVFDPAIMPSTGTPEPGGFSWYDVTTLLDGVIKTKNIVGLDVVELCPNPANKAPDFLAAKLIYRLLSVIYAKGKK